MDLDQPLPAIFPAGPSESRAVGSPLHLILHCSYSRTVWLLVAQWLDLPVLATNAQNVDSIHVWWNDLSFNLGERATTMAIYTAWDLYMEGTQEMIFRQQDFCKTMHCFNLSSNTFVSWRYLFMSSPMLRILQNRSWTSFPFSSHLSCKQI